MFGSNIIRWLDRPISLLCKLLVVMVLIQYGWMTFYTRMAGFKLYSHHKIKDVYAFEHIDFTQAGVRFVLDDGHLIITERAGEENCIVAMGRGYIFWPLKPPLRELAKHPLTPSQKVLIALNERDLKQLIENHMGALHRILDFESDMLSFWLARRGTQEVLKRDEQARRFQIPGLGFTSLSMFQPLPPGAIAVELYSGPGQPGVYTYGLATDGSEAYVSRKWITVGSIIAFFVAKIALLLLLALLAAVLLACFIHIGRGIATIARGLKRLGRRVPLPIFLVSGTRFGPSDL